MLIWIASILGGFLLLMWSAERFVLGASSVARNLGVSPLIIGLTVVGFGTSAPEILVSLIAAIEGSPNIGIGNAIGSNIANIGLVLGGAALISPMVISSGIINREMPFLLLAMMLALAVIWDQTLSLLDSLLLLLLLLFILGWMIRKGIQQHNNNDILQQEFENEIPSDMTLATAIFWLLLGMAVLIGSSRLLVWGASNIATALGVSDLIIGLTIVAVGTSLPELAASIASVLKKEYDLAIGNIIGSNIFNILIVFGVPAFFQTVDIDDAVIGRDMPVMFALTVVMVLLASSWKNKAGKISRISGGLLLSAFIAYQCMLLLSN